MRTLSARADENGVAGYRSYFEKTLLPELRKRAFPREPDANVDHRDVLFGTEE